MELTERQQALYDWAVATERFTSLSISTSDFKHINKLVELGLLRKERRTYTNENGMRQTYTKYELNDPTDIARKRANQGK